MIDFYKNNVIFYKNAGKFYKVASGWIWVLLRPLERLGDTLVMMLRRYMRRGGVCTIL